MQFSQINLNNIKSPNNKVSKMFNDILSESFFLFTRMEGFAKITHNNHESDFLRKKKKQIYLEHNAKS